MRRLLVPILSVLAWLAVPGVSADDDSASERRGSRGSSVVQGAEPPAARPPLAPPVIEVERDRALGSPTAPLAVVEFADYQCPYCRRFHLEMLPRLRAEYIDSGKVRYFYKDLPLPGHAHAFSAAVSAYCAGAQERKRYWEMQNLLYQEQRRLGGALYAELAARLGLDRARFERCLDSNAARRAVQRDLAHARQLGVRVTPTIVLGRLEGDRVVIERVAAGLPAYRDLAAELDALAR